MFDKGQERERIKRQKNKERKKALPDRKKKMKVVLSRKPTETTDLTQFKEPVLAYELCSPRVRQKLNNWATRDRIILRD